LVENDKIELQSDPRIDNDSGYGVFLLAKEHMTYDGSLHFTVKMPMIETGTPYFGIFIK